MNRLEPRPSDPVQVQNEERFRQIGIALQEVQRKANEERARRDTEAMREELIKIYSVLFDKGQAYTTLIVTLAYAGFFTLWNNTRPMVPIRVSALSALLVMISLMVFLGWEVFQMHLRNKDSQAMLAIVEAGGADLLAKLEAAKVEAGRRKLQLGRLGVRVIWLTVYPGFAGALILMGALVPRLFWPTGH